MKTEYGKHTVVEKEKIESKKPEYVMLTMFILECRIYISVLEINAENLHANKLLPVT